ncbi:MAG: hypothetical protein KDD42_03870 [Bdellovibrionales bacterium]|nr:hypothetical protein [Bdellovibrionales bacterium]
MRKLILLLVLANLLLSSAFAEPAPTEPSAKPTAQGLFSTNGLDDGPTLINADKLFLKAKERFFVYTGNVDVTHGDLHLTSDILEGKYSESNEITELVAKKNVVIVKGENIKAYSQRATYEKSSETLLLTENPSVEQDGSNLSADAIRIFLNEDRSVAEGTVRVKMLKAEEEKPAKKAADQKTQPEAPVSASSEPVPQPAG